MTSAKTPTPDYVRLRCRVKSHIKQQAKQAASLLGQSITDFIEAALAEKAQSVLEQHEQIIFSERDFARFVEMIENPPLSTQELQNAMADYGQLKAAHPNANL